MVESLQLRRSGKRAALEVARRRIHPEIVRVPWVLRAAAVLFVVSTIFDSFTFSFLEKSDNMAQLVGFAMAGLFLVFRGRYLRFREKDLLWFVVFFGITVVEEMVRYATLSTSMASSSLTAYFSYAQVFVLYIIIRDISKDPRVFRGLSAAFLLTYLISAGLISLGVRMVTVEAGMREGLVGVNLNGFAFSLAVIVVGIISRSVFRWPRLRTSGWVLVAMLLILVPILAKTGSRGGALALIVGLLGAFLVNIRLKRVPAYFLLVPLVLGGVMYVMLTTEVMHERLDATFYHHDYGTRDQLAEQSFRLLKKHPILGPGPAYAQELGMSLGTTRLAAHNTYLQVLLSFGFFGFVPFAIAVYLGTRRLWRFRFLEWSAIGLGVVFVLLAEGVSLHLAYDKSFWIILALLANAHRVDVKQGVQVLSPSAGVRRRFQRVSAARLGS